MEIKDVLKYYIGGKCQFGILVPGQPTSYEESNITIRVLHNVLAALADAKPILRPLSSMTEEEMKELYCCDIWALCLHSDIQKIGFDGDNKNCILLQYSGRSGGTGYRSGNTRLYLNRISTYQYNYLLSRHFDLFGLIGSGQAIDATKKHNNE